jgi:hypothetical protein
MKKYKSQSLAIILVSLVVGSLVAFALYARIAREADRAVSEKAASEANELTETIIGLVSTTDYDDIKKAEVLDVLYPSSESPCTEEALYSGGCRRSNITLVELNDFAKALGLENVDLTSFDFDDGVEGDYCSVEIAMRYNSPEDAITIEPDDAYSVFLNRVDWDSCDSIDFYMEDNDSSEGFVMSAFYGNDDEDGNFVEYKEYEQSDIHGFLYSGSEENWIDYNPPLTFPSLDYLVTKDNFPLYELRFKSLGGTSDLSWVVSGDCEIKNYIIMEVGSTCGDKYVGKDLVLHGAVFSPPIFDYVLFNGFGELKID